MRVDLYADETVVSFGAIVNWSQYIRCHADVFHFELFKKTCGIYFRRSVQNLLDRGIVVATGRNRFFENRRIAGDPADPVFIHQLLKFLGGCQIVPNVIKPEGLAQGFNFLQWVHSYFSAIGSSMIGWTLWGCGCISAGDKANPVSRQMPH